MDQFPPPCTESTGDAPFFLAGGGEMGALIRAHDWAGTRLGPPAQWPQSLKTAIRIMLTSRQPIWIGWGGDLLFFYNDAYKSIIGGKHPTALGQPTITVWQEIWDDIGPLLRTAMQGTEGTYVEKKFLLMERNGYPEETYYTFSYSPIPADEGGAGGIICANTDDTAMVVGDRKVRLLHDLAGVATRAHSWDEACVLSVGALASDPHDLPFALLYVAAPDGETVTLAGGCGFEQAAHPATPAEMRVGEPCAWPIADVLRRQDALVLDDLPQRFPMGLPRGPWRHAPTRALLMPITPAGATGRGGVLIVGLNPYRLLGEDYRDFLDLVASQVSAAIAHAHAYEEERRRATALAEIDRAKTAFFSNISHEFRTPLTLMLGPLEEMLQQSSANDAQRPLLDVSYRNGLRLLKLVNGLLEFARIEAGRVQAHYAPTDLAAVTTELASLFRSATDRAGLALIVECQALPEPVYVDRDMWEKIFLNLLSNAFKFTFEGSIRVTLDLSPDGHAVQMLVSDTGIGISAEELPHIFTRFRRVNGAVGRSIEGSGIGLALVQELVRLQGGDIAVASELGVGTTFTVTLPRGTGHLPADSAHGRTIPDERDSDAEPAVGPRANNQRNAGRHCGSALAGSGSTSVAAQAFIADALRWVPDEDGFLAPGSAQAPAPVPGLSSVLAPIEDGKTVAREHVLVVDDNADLRDYVGRILAMAGYRVSLAVNGEEGLACARRDAPGLILSDIMMPALDGFGLLAAVRADVALREVPVLLMSARAGEEARVEGLAAGADDYLTKPFSARELLARVTANVQMYRLRQDAARRLKEHARVLEAEVAQRAVAEEALRHLNETLEARVADAVAERDRLWELSADLLAIGDFDGNLLRVSPSWTRVLGYSREWLMSRHYSELVHPDDQEAARETLRSLRAHGRPLNYEGRMQTTTGAWRWIAWTMSVDRERDSVHGVGRDVTADKEAAAALRQAEEALRMAQKMEAVGKLTGGIAHDFNNLLQVVGGNLQLLAREVSGNERADKRVRNALDGVARGAKLASQLLAFGRRQPLAPKVVNLGRFLRGMDDMLRRALGDAIEIETVVSGGLWNTLVDPSQVENALLNLAINARDAMHGHGKLTIELGNAVLDDSYVSRHVDVTPGQYVMVAVTDTGSGMSPEVLAQVFEPFFTTKAEGRGTGLGLSMVYGFIKQSNGHIKIYSEPGQGATVRFYLPRIKQDEDLVADVDAGPIAGGTETILAVEDDEDVRATVVDMLSELGYRVLRAKDALSALAIVESGVPIDLLFTDVVMPGPLRSPELARKTRERLPNVAVLFTSGYTENAIMHGGRLDEGIELLSKPYTREAMARKIRHVLRNQQQRNAAPDARQGRLQLAAGEADRAGAHARHERSWRVLLVEDDGLIRSATAQMLEGLGHRVLQADQARSAMALLESHAVEVLMTDIDLPEVSGVVLAARARLHYPRLRVIFASGHDAGTVAGEGDVTDAVHLLKPYGVEDLARVLDQLGP